jgi:hypothetical protein
VKLSFHGADRDVTGSCHMLEVAGKRLLIDCGLFQGGRELDEENEQAFRFDPASIDVVPRLLPRCALAGARRQRQSQCRAALYEC